MVHVDKNTITIWISFWNPDFKIGATNSTDGILKDNYEKKSGFLLGKFIK